MSTVKKPPGRKRGEVTADEWSPPVTIRRVAEACGLSPMGAAIRPTGSRRSDEVDHPGATWRSAVQISDPNIHAW